ncbi:hypothetical protein [Sulfurimonas sp.]|uniref:hypothetical protein n=1 Tax=Sulfurimonas sp. TaxID=2022749 RepID=UPI0025ECD082|nr:hypothetical protein [Sulfurimonas sp.]
MDLSLILQPLIDSLIENLFILIGAMLSFLAFIYACKKLLDLLGLDDYKTSREAKRQIKREDRQASIRTKKQEYRTKELQSQRFKETKKQEKQALSEYRQSQKIKATTEQKLRAKNGRVVNVQKRLDKKQNALSKRVSKAYTSKTSTSSKKTNRRDFMSKKYRETVFNNPLR